MRGCVRVAGRDLDLRPKAFHLLCHLAVECRAAGLQAGTSRCRLGPVAVSDDTLVGSASRELRQKLGEVDRMLIRTVPRRGYLLNASKDWPAA